MAFTSLTGARRRRRSILLLVALAVLGACVLGATPAFAATFDPTKVITDDNFRAYDSMNQADIQAFLKTSPVLASLSATDYATGKKGSAAQIIYHAAQAWHISPKVILTMLQKEQSLLTRDKSSLVTGSRATVDWALGMGCPDSYGDPSKHTGCYLSGCHTKQPSIKRLPEYRGFGNQIWAACQSLDAYGEKGKFRPQWHHIKTKTAESSSWAPTWKMSVDTPTGSTTLTFKDIATFKLYTYNPSVGAKSDYKGVKGYGDLSKQAKASWMGGNANFWLIYRSYFGDTFANPRMRPIYRFIDTVNGGYLFTQSPAERYTLLGGTRYKFDTIAFSWDASNTANSSPVYRFLNRKTRRYLYTASQAQYDRLTSKSYAPTWRYEGVTWFCCKTATGTPVFQFNNKKTGIPFYTVSTAERATYRSATYQKTWADKGIAFYLAP